MDKLQTYLILQKLQMMMMKILKMMIQVVIHLEIINLPNPEDLQEHI